MSNTQPASSNCACDCRYTAVATAETLPLIEKIARMFPDEWLAFIVSPAEDDDPFPTHGSLVAHSPHPDEIFDAINTVLWNQCVYTFFNGSAEAMQASYGNRLAAQTAPAIVSPAPPTVSPVPEKLLDLIHSALDQLYLTPPRPAEAIRRLRIARLRAGYNPHSDLLPLLDQALDGLETPQPDYQAVRWELEESLSAFEINLT